MKVKGGKETYNTLSPRRPARPSLIFRSICSVQKIVNGITVKIRSVAELNTPCTYPVSVCTSGDQHLLGSPTGFQRLCTLPHCVKMVIAVKRLAISCSAIRKYRNQRRDFVLPNRRSMRNMKETRPRVLHMIAMVLLVGV
jgi:hypothetical protein